MNRHVATERPTPTCQDVLDAPANMVAELIDGALHLQPRPAFPHAHLWMIDPTAWTLEAFALRDGAWMLIAALKDDEEVRVPPFDAIAFALAALWPD